MGLNFEKNKAPSLLTDSITSKAILDGWPLASITSRLQRTLFQAKSLHEFAARSNGALMLIKSKRDLALLEDARAQGRPVVGGLLGIEGLHALDDSFASVKVIFDAGEPTSPSIFH